MRTGKELGKNTRSKKGIAIFMKGMSVLEFKNLQRNQSSNIAQFHLNLKSIKIN